IAAFRRRSKRLKAVLKTSWRGSENLHKGESHACPASDRCLLSLTHIRRFRATANRDAGFSTGLCAIILRSGSGSRTEREGIVVLSQRNRVVDRERPVGIADSGAVPVHGLLRAHS